jgi:hypothetical protein
VDVKKEFPVSDASTQPLTDWSQIFGPTAAQAAQAVAPAVADWGRQAFQNIGAFANLNSVSQNAELTRLHVAQAMSGEKLPAAQIYEAMKPSPLGSHETTTNITVINPTPDAAQPAPQPYVQPAPIVTPQPAPQPVAYTAPTPAPQPVAAVAPATPGLTGLAKNKVAGMILAGVLGTAGGAAAVALNQPDPKPLPMQVVEGTVYWEHDLNVERESASQQQQQQFTSPGPVPSNP